MVFHAANLDGLHAILSGDTAEKRPEALAQFRLKEWMAFLGVENTMEIGPDVGHGTYSAVPSELMQFGISPGVETPGYCRMSRWDSR